MSQCSDPQTCETCGTVAKKQVTPINFNLPGDDWASKNGRIAKQRAEARAKAGVKQAERVREAPGVKLVPNVDGERVGSWAEAQKLAKSKGKDTTSYAPKIAAEQKK
jgi:hypothetical protein